MSFSLKMEVILILVMIISMLVGFINQFLHMRYLKKHKTVIYNSLENKKSIIKLPIFMNLDPKKFWKYSFVILKEKDKRLKMHKIIYLTTSFIVITVLIILLMNPVE